MYQTIFPASGKRNFPMGLFLPINSVVCVINTDNCVINSVVYTINTVDLIFPGILIIFTSNDCIDYSGELTSLAKEQLYCSPKTTEIGILTENHQLVIGL